MCKLNHFQILKIIKQIEEKKIDDNLSNEIELMTQELKFNSSNRITEEEIELKEIKLITYRILHNNKFKERIYKRIKKFLF